MRKSLVVPVVVLGAFAIASAGEASASPTYPRVVAETLGMECVPQCVLCHQTTPGRAGNASKPFALELKARGLDAEEPGRLRVILDEEKGTSAAGGEGGASSPADGDRDGLGDFEELLGNPPSDPNGRVSEICAVSLQYGCEVSRPSSRASTSFVAFLPSLLLVGAFAFFARRRSSSRARRG